MATELPQDVQGQIAQLQQIQQQAQIIGSQKAQMDAMLRENENALAELGKAPDDVAVYKSAGGIMVRSAKADVVKGLTEQKEQLELRVKTMERQQERLQKRFEQLQDSIKEQLGTGMGKLGGGGPVGA